MINHLALIMDGNRRWARAQGLPAFMGHKAGADVAKQIVLYCLDHSIAYLSLYLFSIENLKRTEEEKSYLFDLLARVAQEYADQFARRGVRIRFVGDRALFPAGVRDVCERVEAQTAAGDKLQVNLLFCYGGQQEIVAGVKKCVRQACVGMLSEDEITPHLFNTMLWSGHSPSPELIVRTGGVSRLSNFLLFACAYSELFFTDTLWPALTIDELERMIQRYEQVKRNFGS